MKLSFCFVNWNYGVASLVHLRIYTLAVNHCRCCVVLSENQRIIGIIGMSESGYGLTDMLEEMDVQSFKELLSKVDRAIVSYESRKRKEALSAVEQTAKEYGFKLSELFGKRKLSRSRKSTGGRAKYVNPENTEQTWSGRGRRPQWVNDAVEAGRTLSEMAS
ncbi:H-NS histone family protein [Paracoccus niistensis]|uniref:H-NS family nucleoid-associated regulatory protein n=1 Tax=Paracoccus niistensis TaxID=632935 RepID=A0ABV6I8E9_9RHOB